MALIALADMVARTICVPIFEKKKKKKKGFMYILDISKICIDVHKCYGPEAFIRKTCLYKYIEDFTFKN